jgi:hypothetical protein
LPQAPQKKRIPIPKEIRKDPAIKLRQVPGLVAEGIMAPPLSESMAYNYKFLENSTA